MTEKSFIKICSSVIGYLSRLNAPLSANCDPDPPDVFCLVCDFSQSCSFEYSYSTCIVAFMEIAHFGTNTDILSL